MNLLPFKPRKKRNDRKKLPPPSAWGHYRVMRGRRAAGRYADAKKKKETVLSLSDVTLGYGAKEVVSHLSLEVKEGDYVSVIGDNGSGKSTLFSAISGISSPLSGKLELYGIKRDEIGVIHQEGDARSDFPATVYEVVLTGCLGRGARGPFITRRAKELAFASMEKLGITAISSHAFGTLSGGQKQRTLLARALCASDRMLLLDEPVTGLDPKTVSDIYSLIHHLNEKQGVTVICVTHDIPSALKYSSHILRLSHDSSFYGTADEYLALPEAEKYTVSDAKDEGEAYGDGGFRYRGGSHD